MRADMWSTLAVGVFVFFFIPMRLLHRGAPAERCCVSASLGLSQRWTRRLSSAGSGLGTGGGGDWRGDEMQGRVEI